jgi:hypothetical protein
MYYFMAMKAKVMKPTALFSSKFNYLSKKQGASLTGYEGNSTFIVPMVPTIVRGNAEYNSWYREK